jgi:serine/threonine-protein kinase
MVWVCRTCGKVFEQPVRSCSRDRGECFKAGEADLKPVGRDMDGRYHIKRLLGVGGMGAVYEARQSAMVRDVALKLVRSDLVTDAKVVKRFMRETLAVSRLTNPHTVSVFDFGQTKSLELYMVMELLRGRSLEDLLFRSGPLDPDLAVTVAGQVLDSLAEAHALGIVHRDLKPSNIFMCDVVGAQGFVKVLDFGLAKLTGSRTVITESGVVCGTPAYMSPEQAQGRSLDGRSDIYSFGVALFELLAGAPPFAEFDNLGLPTPESRGKPRAISDARPGAAVSASLEKAIAQLLALRPGDRPRDAGAAKGILFDAAWGGEARGTRVVFVPVPPPESRPPPPALPTIGGVSPASVWIWLAVAAVAGIAAGAVAAVAYLW